MKKKIKNKKIPPIGKVLVQNPNTEPIFERVCFVLAGNYKQFEEYVRPRQSKWTTFIFADRYERIAGVMPSDYDIVGTFWSRPDARKIADGVQRRFHIQGRFIEI